MDRGFTRHLRAVALMALAAYALAAGCAALTFAAPDFGRDPNRVLFLYVPPQAYAAVLCALLGAGMAVWVALLGAVSSVRRKRSVWALIFAALLAICATGPILLFLQTQGFSLHANQATPIYEASGIALVITPLAALVYSTVPHRAQERTREAA